MQTEQLPDHGSAASASASASAGIASALVAIVPKDVDGAHGKSGGRKYTILYYAATILLLY